VAFRDGRRADHSLDPYLALAAWAEREPDDFTRFGHLDTSKLYRIAALPTKARNKLKTDAPIRIPGGIPKLLDAMSVAELDRVLGGLATPPVRRSWRSWPPSSAGSRRSSRRGWVGETCTHSHGHGRVSSASR
jgi:hypothetical protein